MRIGIYDPYLDDVGGGEKYMLTIARCLVTDHEVSIFWDDARDLKKACERFGIDQTQLKITPNIFSDKFSFFARLKESNKYDAIIVLSDGSIPFLFSRKLFIHLQQPLKQFQSVSLKDRLKIARVTKFFCNSKYTKRFVGEKFGLKTIVLYPPVDLKPKNLKRENIILHVGRFRPFDRSTGATDYKKQHVMILAFKEMVRNGLDNWKFVLAVSVNDNQKDEFEKMKKQTKGFPIEFLVNKTNDELWDIYSKAKIYWHASGYDEDLEKHPEFAEHFGISTVEAMGAGAVPIVISAGGQKEIVQNGENGLLWSSLKELKDETSTVAKNIGLWERLSISARKRAEDFAGDRFCKEVKQLISHS